MVVLVNEETRVLVQGITGHEGSFHTKLMLDYGTRIVAGVTPGKGGLTVHGVPVYDSVENAVSEHPEINASIIFVPARYAADAAYEAIDAGIPLVVIITEHIPVHDTARLISYAKYKGSKIVGPNTPGVISPGLCKLGIMPSRYFSRGKIGIVSRSGTLTYEISNWLTHEGLGVSTAVGIGGDPITGLTLLDVVRLFEEDADTEAVVLIGEIGGTAEEEVALAVKRGEITKPMVAYIAGKSAPPGKKMGHAGAIIEGGRGTYESKVRSLEDAGVPVAKTPRETAKLIKKFVSKR